MYIIAIIKPCQSTIELTIKKGIVMVVINRINQTHMTEFSKLAKSVMEQYQSTELWRCEVQVGGQVFEKCSEGSLGQVESKMREKLTARRLEMMSSWKSSSKH
jgi:hypothetical protein